MAVPHLNTSRAKKVVVDLFNYDSLPLSAAYNSNGLPIDLTAYAFTFYLFDGDTLRKTYAIAAGVLASDYLDKTGADVNVIEMKKMFEHIRDNIKLGNENYRVLQVVTDTTPNTYVHIIYQLHGRKY